MTDRGCYILDGHLEPAPPGVLGELYLAEQRLAGSYLGGVQIAAERFVADPFAGAGRRMYRTGELVRQGRDGLIEPVQPAGPASRGPELAQVRFALANHPQVRHVAVTCNGGGDSEPIAAYVEVVDGHLDPAELHAQLANLLPERLVPAAIAVVGGLPLAAPAIADGTGRSAVELPAGEPLGTAHHDTLRALFAELLDRPEVGLHDSFLELGGQSVTAMLLISRVNAALGVELSIAELFDAPTVAELAGLLAGRATGPTNPFDSDQDRYTVLVDEPGRHSLWPATVQVPEGWTVLHGPAERADCLAYVARHWTDQQPAGPATEPAPAGVAETFPLSYNQEFFCELDEGTATGSFSDRHTLVNGWRLTGPVDVPALQLALNDVVDRHEILRTVIRRDEQPRCQLVHPPGPARLRVRELAESGDASREFQCEQLLTEVEAEPLRVRELPLLRAVLGRFDERDSVLVLAAHHIAVDAWSMQLLIRDLATSYAVRRGFELPLPAVHQYREYCLAQRAESDPAAQRAARDYWRRGLRGARACQLPTRPTETPAGLSNYAMQSFVIGGELARDTVQLANRTHSSPFMVLLAAFYLLAHELTGDTDLVVPTFTTGRYQARFRDTVGPFLNLLPVRTELAGSRTFAEVLARTRASCVQAYSHDIPFECIEPEAPQLYQEAGTAGRTPIAFEMVQSPAQAEGELIGDVRYAEVHRRLLVEGDCPDIPNGMLWILNLVATDDIVGTIQFKRTEFSPGAVAELVSAYRRLLRQSVTAPEAELDPNPHRIAHALELDR